MGLCGSCGGNSVNDSTTSSKMKPSDRGAKNIREYSVSESDRLPPPMANPSLSMTMSLTLASEICMSDTESESFLKKEEKERKKEAARRIIHDFKSALDDDDVSRVKQILDDAPKKWKLLNRIIDSKSQMNVLMYCLWNEKRALVSHLLSECKEINIDYQRKTDGMTAVHLAVLRKDAALVQDLVDKGANVYLTDTNGDTPLELCRKTGHDFEIFDILHPLGELDPRSSLFSTVSEKDHRREVSTRLDEVDLPTVEEGGEEEMPEKDRLALESYGSDFEAAERVRQSELAPLKVMLKEMSTQHMLLTEDDDSDARRSRLTRGESGADDEYRRSVSEMHEEKIDTVVTVKRHLDHMIDARKKLPKLEGWLMKKSPRGMTYQRRWVIVRDGYLLWNDKQRELLDANDEEERAQWNGQMYLLHIKRINEVISKSKLKFEISRVDVRKKMNEKVYLWKAETTEERDRWVNGIEEHHQYIKDMIAYLQTAGS